MSFFVNIFNSQSEHSIYFYSQSERAGDEVEALLAADGRGGEAGKFEQSAAGGRW